MACWASIVPAARPSSRSSVLAAFSYWPAVMSSRADSYNFSGLIPAVGSLGPVSQPASTSVSAIAAPLTTSRVRGSRDIDIIGSGGVAPPRSGMEGTDYL